MGIFRRYQHVRQRDTMDCGAASLKMVLHHFGRTPSYASVVAATFKSRQGVSVFNLCGAAEKFGMTAKAVMCTVADLQETRSFPCILHWNQNHFVVLHDIRGGKAVISDPNADGVVKVSLGELQAHWYSLEEEGQKLGVALFLNPNTATGQTEAETTGNIGFHTIFGLLKLEVMPIVQLALVMAVGLVLTLLLPLFTQAQIDAGVSLADASFLKVLLLGQFMVLMGLATSFFFRRWILVYLSSRVNFSLITGFMARLLRLPMTYFDQRNFGDIVARLDDHMKIELFLNSNAFEIVFVFLSILIYAGLLASYYLTIFAVFLVGILIISIWSWRFFAVRRSIDFKRFGLLAESQMKELQLISGTQEMRLSGCEKLYRDDWLATRAKLFHVGIRSMKVEQWQLVGATFAFQAMSVACAFLGAWLVITGDLSLGMLMAIGLILGQLSGPVTQSLEFLKLAQDASIAMERIQDVYATPTEAEGQRGVLGEAAVIKGGLSLDAVCFRYGDPDIDYILKDLSLHIPEGKTTAVVGQSGSGKTTLLKLLLRLYDAEKGSIRLDNHDLREFELESWRRECGVVMQEGFVFSDSILRNITFSESAYDATRLEQAVDAACIREFVDRLPYGLSTRVGNDGLALSVGQKQRILIARALYKRPRYVFFDEATSALDTENEQRIVENLEKILAGCTRIIVAHRLSTVRTADRIIVLDQGRVCEQGTHAELVARKGRYFGLVSEQLALAAS